MSKGKKTPQNTAQKNKPDIAAEYTYAELDKSRHNKDEDQHEAPEEHEARDDAEDEDSALALSEAPTTDHDQISLKSSLVAGQLPSRLDPLKAYIREISQYALLSLEEEKELSRLMIEEGDLVAAKRLVTANLRLVVKIALEYHAAHNNVMDLIQEGNIGLMKAVSKYDPTKGAKLSYYASWWIRSYILKFILDNFRLVKIGTTQAQKKLFYQLMREKDRLEAQGIEAGPKLLADKLNVKEKEIIEMSQRLGGAGAEVSLDKPLLGDGDEGAGSTRGDFLVDEQTLPDDRLALEELTQKLHDILPEFGKLLKEKEKTVFTERLMAEEPKTLQEIADKYGLTRERARQIESRVLEKLKEFYSERLKPHR